MRLTIVTLAALALVSCNKAEAPVDNAADTNATADLNAADANAAADANVAGTALTTINETSWEFTQDGKPMQESIDAKGNYTRVLPLPQVAPYSAQGALLARLCG